MEKDEESSCSDDYHDNANECTYNDDENVFYEVDPKHTQYLQDSFQDEIIENIYEKVSTYIRDQALPLCENIEYDDIEEIINLIGASI